MLAQEEARLLGHGFIGTEHILLGLIQENEGVAAQALANLEISVQAVRAKVEETIGSSGGAPPGSPPFTPRAKKVLELSLREALQLGHNYIGTEHMLLGLVREGEGVGAQVLVGLGADLASVRQQVVRILSGHRGSGAARGFDRPVPSMRGAPPLECSFCGSRPPETGRLVAGDDALICEHCLTSLSARVAAGEFDDTHAIGLGGESDDAAQGDDAVRDDDAEGADGPDGEAGPDED